MPHMRGAVFISRIRALSNADLAGPVRSALLFAILIFKGIATAVPLRFGKGIFYLVVVYGNNNSLKFELFDFLQRKINKLAYIAFIVSQFHGNAPLTPAIYKHGSKYKPRPAVR